MKRLLLFFFGHRWVWLLLAAGALGVGAWTTRYEVVECWTATGLSAQLENESVSSCRVLDRWTGDVEIRRTRPRG